MNKDELKTLFDKLKKDKKTLIILMIGFIGMLLVATSETVERKKVSEVSESIERNVFTEIELAAETEKLIETIKGAGKTKVMITYKSYEETVYAYDRDENTDTDGKRDFKSEYIILDSGDKEEGMKIKTILPEINGVAVVCEGGENPVIKEQIISALSALFDISSNKISVAVMAK